MFLHSSIFQAPSKQAHTITRSGASRIKIWQKLCQLPMRRGPDSACGTTAREKVKNPTLAQTARMGHPALLLAKCGGGVETGGSPGGEARSPWGAVGAA